MKNPTNILNTYARKISWDSKVFGYGVAQITNNNLSATNLEKTLIELNNNNISLVYWITDSSKKNIPGNGKLVDTKITFIRNINDKDFIENRSITSYINRQLDKDLLSLTLQSGKFSRFNTDKKFKEDEYEKLYSAWIQKSLDGEIAKDVLVYEDSFGKKNGLITLDYDKENATIGLLAVDKKVRGKGIGKQLVTEAFRQAYRRSIKYLYVTTQETNIPACNLYLKMGFKKKERKYIYHFWL